MSTRLTAEPIPAANPTPAVPPAGTPPIPPVREDPRSAIAAPSIIELLSLCNSGNALSAEAKQYLTSIRQYFTEHHVAIVDQTVNHPKVTGHIFIDTKSATAVLLLFNETYVSNGTCIPPTAFVKEIKAQLANEYAAKYAGDAARPVPELLETIVVVPEDYSRYEAMAMFIDDLFQSWNGRMREINVDSFRNTRFYISNNIDEVRTFVKMRSPHAVPARCDVGFLISVLSERAHDDALSPYGQNGPNDRYERIPLAAVTGYTRFMNPDENMLMNSKFTPMFTITDIVTSLPSFQLLNLILPIAAQNFITKRGWLRAYNSFSDKRPNIGNLVVAGDQKTPAFVANLNELNHFVADWLNPPFLAIDVADGRARILLMDSIAAIGGGDNNSLLNKGLNAFFKNEAGIIGSSNRTIYSVPSVEGIYNKDGSITDTRYADYLQLVYDIKDMGRAASFLQCMSDPTRHLNDLKTIYPPESIKPLYSNTTTILDSRYVVDLDKLLHDHTGIGIIDDQRAVAYIPLPFNYGIGNQFAFANVFSDNRMPYNNPYTH